ncbi:MAG: PfkB family carbohydrate kinase [Spirochaetota bacterium]
MIVSIGEILFDQFPDYRRIGGAPFNFAVHLIALGLETVFISRVGNDENGSHLIEEISRRNLDPEYVQVDDSHPTGEVLIQLDENKNATFTIRENVAYDFIEMTPSVVSTLNRTDFIYFGTLIQRTSQGFSSVQDMLTLKKPGTICMYDINLRPGCYNREIINASLNHTDILKLNSDELKELGIMLYDKENTDECINSLFDDFNIQMISLTGGSSGSSIVTRDNRFTAEPDHSITVKDTVGAGDAYSAIVAAGFIHGWEPPRILDVATRFSTRICTIEGAIPRDLSFYSEFRKLFQESQ